MLFSFIVLNVSLVVPLQQLGQSIEIPYFREKLNRSIMETLVQNKQRMITWPEFREMEIPEGDTAIYELINGQVEAPPFFIVKTENR